MNVIYSDSRKESLIWVKRPTQSKDSAKKPSEVSLWPHFIMAINDVILELPKNFKNDLNSPYGEQTIRKDTTEDIVSLKKTLSITDCDIKNLWTRFNRAYLSNDFQINPVEFTKWMNEDPSILSIKKFVEEYSKPANDSNPIDLITETSGITRTDVLGLWDSSLNIVSLFVYGLVCKSFYGHAYRRHVMGSADPVASFTTMVENNEKLLRLFAHSKDYDTRGPNDAISVINAYYDYCKLAELELPVESHFQTLIIPKTALLKEIQPFLKYFDIDMSFIGEAKTASYSSANETSLGNTSKREPILVILQGPPGTGKTRLARNRAKDIDIPNPKICQFHPSYSYEQFVEGIHPVAFVDGTYKYQPVDGPLLISWRKVTGICAGTLCLKSDTSINFPAGILPRYFGIGDKFQVLLTRDSKTSFLDLSYEGFDSFDLGTKANNAFEPPKMVSVYIKGVDWGKAKSELLILDELNRASVPQVFGELLYALSLVDGDMSEEDRLRSPVRLQYSQEPFYWPDGLHIIATLNQADRSTEDLDQALQRRFEIENVVPDSDLLNSIQLDCVKQLNPIRCSSDDLIVWLEKNANLKCSKLSDMMLGINQSLKNNPSVFDADKKLLGQGIFLKAARLSAKAALQSPQAGKDRLVSELRASLISQLQAICNNNMTLIADILMDSIVDSGLVLPRAVIQDVLDSLSEEHPLQGKFALSNSLAA